MMDFRPVQLDEEPAPAHAIACQQCELSKQRKRVIWGEGNPNAPIIVILDNPGAREDKEGKPWVCGTRETLQLGLREAGLGLDNIYVTYLLKCRPLRAYDKPAARGACSMHLELQLAQKKPELLIGLGNVVVQALFPEEEADVKGYRGRWHAYQEIPINFSYHPLAVRRRPVLMKYFIEDLKLAGDRLRTLQTT
jgi:uracil-DNA glycosylase